MSREFDVIAWVDDIQDLCFPEEEFASGNTIFSIVGTKIRVSHHCDCSYPDGYAEYEKYSIMQYIGRKDINGKKIYNDFIVQCDLGIKYKVIFSNEWCAFMLIENKTSRQVVIYPEMKLEVIGNIHQHPELLEK